MPQVIEFYQLGICSLAIAMLITYLSTLPRRSLFFSSLLFLISLLLINLIPVYRGSSIVELLRGVIGDVSSASGVLLLMIVIDQFDFRDVKPKLLSCSEKILLVLLGFVLYLSTFGFISFDLYHLGYLSPQMLLFFAGLTFVLILLNRRLGYIWLFAIISFYFKLQSSNNLWDYLYDPILWLVLMVEILTITFNHKFRKDYSK